MVDVKQLDHAKSAAVILDSAEELLSLEDQGKAEEAMRLLKIAEVHALLAIQDELNLIGLNKW